jgi:hypothetical protein
MRIATWDSGDPEMYFDNPNLHWGAAGQPAYLLEPGDAGYIPPFPTVETTNTKKHMKKKHDLVPAPQAAYLKWHDNLKGGVTATTPGATAADVTMLLADNTALHAKTTAADAADTAAKTAHADLAAVIATSKRNARALAQRIKKSTGCTPALTAALQLDGVEDTTDMTQEKPAVTVTAKGNGVMEVGFNKKLAEGVHIYEDRAGTGVFNYLGSETHSPYVDNRPLLAAGKPETRRYKLVFFIGKAEIGLESDIVEASAHP